MSTGPSALGNGGAESLVAAGASLAGAYKNAELIVLLRELDRKVDELAAQVGYLNDRARAVEELKDELAPLVKDVLREGINRLDRAEQRGYFRLARRVFSEIESYSGQEIDALASNIGRMLETVKNFTQPQVLETANRVLEQVENGGAPQRLSLWGLLRTLRDSELQRALGFAVAVLRGVSRQMGEQGASHAGDPDQR